MVKRVTIKERIKPVIDALREGKKSQSELVKLGIPKRTLNKILKEYLQYWGLVRKEGNYWIWYENLRVFSSSQEYDLAIEHSRKLIPAIKNMLEVAIISRHPLHFAAVEHLKSGYPDIYQRHEKLEQLFNERVRELLQKHRSKIKTPNRFMLMHFEKSKGFGKLFDKQELVEGDVPYFIDESELSEAEKKEVKELKSWLDESRAFDKRFAVYYYFSADIAQLSFKVDMGKPIEGVCSICPKVRISRVSLEDT